VKVKELIEKLQQFPEDMEVFAYDIPCKGSEIKYLACDVNIKEERFVEINSQIAIAQRPCKKTKGARKCLVI